MSIGLKSAKRSHGKTITDSLLNPPAICISYCHFECDEAPQSLSSTSKLAVGGAMEQIDPLLPSALLWQMTALHCGFNRLLLLMSGWPTTGCSRMADLRSRAQVDPQMTGFGLAAVGDPSENRESTECPLSLDVKWCCRPAADL